MVPKIVKESKLKILGKQRTTTVGDGSAQRPKSIA